MLPCVLCGKTVKQRNLIQQKTMKKLQKILECILAFLMFLRGGTPKNRTGTMREINLIVIHCSATREDRCFTEYDLEECHRRRGFDGAGYHFYIRKNGKIVTTRPVERIGAHAKGFNAHSIGICYEGGLDCNGRPKDTTDRMAKTFDAGTGKSVAERLREARYAGTVT